MYLPRGSKSSPEVMELRKERLRRPGSLLDHGISEGEQEHSSAILSRRSTHRPREPDDRTSPEYIGDMTSPIGKASIDTLPSRRIAPRRTQKGGRGAPGDAAEHIRGSLRFILRYSAGGVNYSGGFTLPAGPSSKSGIVALSKQANNSSKIVIFKMGCRARPQPRGWLGRFTGLDSLIHTRLAIR